jgi:ABC-type glycerol-3-phosphate transport system substrate-binding protein
MLAKYLTNPEVNTNVTLLGSEGYIPVRESAYETDLWIEWSQVGDMVTKAANTLVQDINGSYLTTKVFKGSAALREKIGGVIASVCKTGTPVSKAVGDAINAAKTQM